MKKVTVLLTIATSIAFLTSSYANKSNVLAVVNGKKITKEDQTKFEKSLPPALLANQDKNKLKSNIINQLVDIEVLKQSALKSGIDKTKEVQNAIEKAKEQVIINAFIIKQLESKINDKAIEAEYNNFKKEYAKKVKNKKEMKLRHILVNNENEAKSIIKKLDSGQDFQKLARELSADKESAKNGGDIGYILEGTIQEFDKHLQAIKVGKYSQTPVKSKLGYHVFKIEDRRKAQAPKFENIKRQLSAKVQQDALAQLVKKLRDKATVEIM